MTSILVVNLDEDKYVCIIYSLRYRSEVKAKTEELILIFVVKKVEN